MTALFLSVGSWRSFAREDVTTNGRPIKIVSIVDERTRECLGGLVERGITGENVVAELDRLAGQRGTYPGGAAVRQRTRISLQHNGRMGPRARGDANAITPACSG